MQERGGELIQAAWWREEETACLREIWRAFNVAVRDRKGSRMPFLLPMSKNRSVAKRRPTLDVSDLSGPKMPQVGG